MLRRKVCYVKRNTALRLSLSFISFPPCLVQDSRTLHQATIMVLNMFFQFMKHHCYNRLTAICKTLEHFSYLYTYYKQSLSQNDSSFSLVATAAPLLVLFSIQFLCNSIANISIIVSGAPQRHSRRGSIMKIT